jgi:hypothetical protein
MRGCTLGCLNYTNRNISVMANLLKALSAPASGDTGALAEKMNNIDAYKSATTPQTSAPAPVKPVGSSPKDKVNPKAQYGDRGKEKRIDVTNMVKPLGTLGSYKKGGKVRKTGVYKLHAKERVLNSKQTKKLEGLAKGLSK